jgi:hypothetical protein
MVKSKLGFKKSKELQQWVAALISLKSKITDELFRKLSSPLKIVEQVKCKKQFEQIFTLPELNVEIYFKQTLFRLSLDQM